MLPSDQTTESPSRIPPRRRPREIRQPESLTVEHVEAALVEVEHIEAPHRHVAVPVRHGRKFVSRASGSVPRPAGETEEKPPFAWKDAAEFGQAQELSRQSGHLVRRRNEKLRFWLMVTGGSALAIGSVLLAVFK